MKDRAVDLARSNILVARLTATMRERGDSNAEAAKSMDVGYAYYMALLRGERPIQDASKSHLAKFAKYLGVSTAQAFIWAGALSASDFFYEKSVAQELHAVYTHMLSNDQLAHLAPSKMMWDNMPLDQRILIAGLYEQATGLKFLSRVKVPSQTANDASSSTTTSERSERV